MFPHCRKNIFAAITFMGMNLGIIEEDEMGLQVDSKDQQLEEQAVHAPLKPEEPTWTSQPVYWLLFIVSCACVRACVRRGQRITFTWFFPYRSGRSNSGHQACLQMPLPSQ